MRDEIESNVKQLGSVSWREDLLDRAIRAAGESLQSERFRIADFVRLGDTAKTLDGGQRQKLRFGWRRPRKRGPNG